MKEPERTCKKRQEMVSRRSLESPVREEVWPVQPAPETFQHQAAYRCRVFVVGLDDEGNGTFMFLGSALPGASATRSTRHHLILTLQGTSYITLTASSFTT